jgi:opacity protein-like surface antigen
VVLVVVAAAAAATVSAPASAQYSSPLEPSALTASSDPSAGESPTAWNFELRFGPYRPNVDSEFADRGSPARPFEQLFSSSRRLMMQFELDRQLVHRAGTWSLGLSAGYYRASAAALTADLTTRSGDETALRLVPLSLAIVYRADQLRQRLGSPLVPYAKAGLDCTLWSMTDTSQADTSGRTFGWHAAAGVSLDLSTFDPESRQSLDRETGVNQTAIFFEVTHYRLDGFGSGTALRVGDTTWFAGVMFEL